MLHRKAKVLLIVRWPVGGIRTFIRYVYHNFDHEKWHLTILAPELPEMRALITDLDDIDIRYIPVEEQPSAICFFIKVAAEILRGGYDLVHSHGFTSGMSAAMPSILLRTAHIMTSHDTLKSEQFKGLKGTGMLIGMTMLFKMINVIHSVSHDAQKNLLEFFPSLARQAGKCIVISNGIEVERFVGAESRDLRNEFGLGNDVFLIGFFGRFMSQKGFRYLVNAVEILLAKKDLTKRPLVLCFGDGGFIHEEKQSIKKRKLEDSFLFLPFTPNIAGSIKGLDVVAMPSLWEACPLLPMEVLVCGVPFIGSNCIGLREVLQGTPATQVPMADAASLAQALALEMDISTKESFSIFRETAMKVFDARNTSQALQTIYKQMTWPSTRIISST